MRDCGADAGGGLGRFRFVAVGIFEYSSADFGVGESEEKA